MFVRRLNKLTTFAIQRQAIRFGSGGGVEYNTSYSPMLPHPINIIVPPNGKIPNNSPEDAKPLDPKMHYVDRTVGSGTAFAITAFFVSCVLGISCIAFGDNFILAYKQIRAAKTSHTPNLTPPHLESYYNPMINNAVLQVIRDNVSLDEFYEIMDTPYLSGETMTEKFDKNNQIIADAQAPHPHSITSI